MTGRLNGKRIAITGAVAGIGRCAVDAFLAEGAKVVIGDLNKEAGTAVAAELGSAVTFRALDVRDEQSVKAFIDGAAGTMGGLDVLCQNAGLQRSGRVESFDAGEWDALFQVNARSHFFGAKYVVPHMRANGGGSIINTSSLAGKRGGPGMTAYSASKGAVVGFTTALALELAGDKIRVNAICPGWVDTPFNQPAIDFMGGRSEQSTVVETYVPLGRQAVPEEMAPLYVYLASDESSYMTSQSINIDGGVYN